MRRALVDEVERQGGASALDANRASAEGGGAHVDGAQCVLNLTGDAAVVGARPDDAAERLARAAFEKGSTDNITAVVVELPSTPAARSEPEAEAE